MSDTDKQAISSLIPVLVVEMFLIHWYGSSTEPTGDTAVQKVLRRWIDVRLPFAPRAILITTASTDTV